MAEKLVFGADIDNVTIKEVNGKLTAILDVENVEDEFEVVTNYVEPQEDDEFYIETVFAKFRHKATQLMTDAFKKEKKPRSTPVNESISETITAEVHFEKGIITILPANNSVTSQVDGKVLKNSEFNSTNAYVEINESDITSTKAFNEANAGKTLTLVTKKRYANSEGHPVVKPTEIQVPYPKLPYEEGTAKSILEHSAYSVGAQVSLSALRELSNSEIINNYLINGDYDTVIRNLDLSSIKMKYELVTADERALTGEVSVETSGFEYNKSLDINRQSVPDYINNTIKREKWSLDPIEVEGKYFKLRITFDPYEETNNF
jgi:hypothetical protein|nr:MAG TPA: hypothetical protein [Caudoviricetes sp.]